MSKQTLCNLCLKNGEVHTMLYSRKNKRYICPSCKALTLPPLKDDDFVAKKISDEIKELMQDLHKANLPAKEPIPAGEALKGGGGSRCKGQNKKGLMQKKSLSQLYKEL